jgi:hypothetical protein
MMRFCPSTNPLARNSSKKPATAADERGAGMRKPSRYERPGSCAVVTSGHAAAPPTILRNVRRLIDAKLSSSDAGGHRCAPEQAEECRLRRGAVLVKLPLLAALCSTEPKGRCRYWVKNAALDRSSSSFEGRFGPEATGLLSCHQMTRRANRRHATLIQRAVSEQRSGRGRNEKPQLRGWGSIRRGERGLAFRHHRGRRFALANWCLALRSSRCNMVLMMASSGIPQPT